MSAADLRAVRDILTDATASGDADGLRVLSSEVRASATDSAELLIAQLLRSAARKIEEGAE